MKNFSLLLISTIFFLITLPQLMAQVGIGTDNPQGALDITSSTSGVVVPRVTLTSKDVAAPIVNPQTVALAESTLVWNTSTAGTGNNSVFPGFYFWQGGQWHALADGSGKDWSLSGNTGTDPNTNFIGTTDATNLVFKTMGTTRMTINNDVSTTSGTAGDISIGDVNSGTIKANKELVMRQDNDTEGSTVLRLVNRYGENGAILETNTALPAAYLVDFFFKTGPSATPNSSNIRFETRADFKKIATNYTELHFGKPDNLDGGPTLVVGANGTGSISSFRIGRVGIGTVTPKPESILDIYSDNKGILIPRVVLTSRDNLSPITGPATTGLLVFNTNTVGTTGLNAVSPGFYYWDAISSLWMRVATENQVNQSVKYSNTDISTSVNPAIAINLPVVSNMEWNDNTALYIANTSSNSITVTQAGRYTIVVNVSLISSVARAAPEIIIAVNGTSTGSYSSTGYIRNLDDHDTASLHLNETLNLAANSVITIKIIQSALTGDVLLRSAGSTNLMINKVK